MRQLLMKFMKKSAKPKSQHGQVPIGTIIIIGLIIIPLVAFGILFSTEIYLWLVEIWVDAAHSE